MFTIQRLVIWVFGLACTANGFTIQLAVPTKQQAYFAPAHLEYELNGIAGVPRRNKRQSGFFLRRGMMLSLGASFSVRLLTISDSLICL